MKHFFRAGATFKCFHNCLKVGYARHLNREPFKKKCYDQHCSTIHRLAVMSNTHLRVEIIKLN